MTFSIDWINPQRGNSGKTRGRGVSTGVRLSNTKYKGTKGEDVKSTQVRLGSDVMQFCRFVVGDKVLFGVANVNGKKYIAIKRDPSGSGFTLSNAKGKSVYGSTKDYGVLKMKRREIPELDVPLEACRLTDEGVLLAPIGVDHDDA